MQLRDAVFLRGGLGNQFFQWVYALFLRQISGRNVELDRSFIRPIPGNQALGTVELNGLFADLQLPIASRYSAFAWAEPALVRIGRTLGAVQIEGMPPSDPRKTALHYGYYQTCAYYVPEVEASVRQALKCAYLELPASLRSAHPLRRAYTAIHLRAGDYLRSGYNFRELGVLCASYYRTALAAVAQLDQPVIVVSDDVARARHVTAGLDFRGLEVHHLADLSVEASKPEVALQVMMNADTLVCANSSFSAMCAYVGPTLKHVFYPRPWFRGASLAGISPARSHWQALAARFELNELGS